MTDVHLMAEGYTAGSHVSINWVGLCRALGVLSMPCKETGKVCCCRCLLSIWGGEGGNLPASHQLDAYASSRRLLETETKGLVDFAGPSGFHGMEGA